MRDDSTTRNRPGHRLTPWLSSVATTACNRFGYALEVNEALVRAYYSAVPLHCFS